MKKRKTFGLYGTNKRKTAKRADKYTEEFYEEYEDYAEEEFAEEYYEEDAYAESDYEGVEFTDGYEDDAYTEEFVEEYYEGDAYAEGDYEGVEFTDGYEDGAYTEEFAEEFEPEELYAEECAEGDYEDVEFSEECAESDYEDVEFTDEYAEEAYEGVEFLAEDETNDTDERYYEEQSVGANAYEVMDQVDDDGYIDAYNASEYAQGYYEDTDYAEDANSYYEGVEEDDRVGGEYYESDDYADDDYYEEPIDAFETAYGEDADMYSAYEDEEIAFGPELHAGRSGIGTRLKDWFRHMNAFDAILASTGVILVIAVVVAGSMYFETKRINEKIEALAPMGQELTEVGIVGEDGLLAMTSSALSGQFATELESETISSLEVIDEEENTPAATSDKVNVNFTSVEKDLKIRFTDANTGQLITGTAFEVVLTNAKGKKLVLTDDDMDGIIYAQNVNPGQFDVVITSTDKYKFPTLAQQVTVKDKVEYVVIRDVQDEVKKESQVNVAAEDTQKQDAQKEEEKIKDTVEWVESTQTPISGTQSYLLVDKSTIADPSQAAKAAARMMFDTLNVSLDKTSLTLMAGSSADLVGTNFTDSTEGDVSYKYKTEWKSSNESVATVSGGKVTAKAAGTATITYTVTRTTITTETVEGETKEVTKTEEGHLTVEEYENLQKEEKDENTVYEFTEEKNENGEITGYTYVKTVTTTEKGEGTTTTKETTDTASASCTVTVEAAKITAASLELSKSAESCSVGGTLTVKPSKLVYTKQDGSTENATSFPTVTWASSDKAIATIDANGVVTGVKEGKVTITATISGVKGAGDKEIPISATTSVTISAAPVFTLTLDRTSEVYLGVGGQTTLVATVTNYKNDAGVTWETSDKKIATVDEKGLVTGVSAGKVTITATTKEKGADGKPLKATCIVTINSNAMSDTTTKLKDKNGNQVYVKDKDGNYREAVYADYFFEKEFYIQSAGQFVYTGWQTINGRTYYYDKNGKAVTGTQVIQGVTYNFDSTGAIATSVNGSTFGIDISRHNGNIDWNAVKASGVDYVIIRCGYRGSATGVLVEDENFKKNIKGATAAGLKVGIYVFSQAVDEVEAVKEASLAVSLAKGYNLTYPIFIDTESSGGRADKIDVATRTAVVNAFCQTVASAGYQPGIYASKTWFESKLNMGAIGNYKIWLAQYAAAPSYKGRYDMWQYSSKGTISGISGKVDLNLSYLGY